jgi:hypothetical protein
VTSELQGKESIIYNNKWQKNWECHGESEQEGQPNQDKMDKGHGAGTLERPRLLLPGQTG